MGTYLDQPNLPDVTKYGVNVSGRAYPDIAAQAENFCVIPGGCSVAGTSCASPTAAGVIAALNDVRLVAGKNNLQDVTTGSNSGCGLFSKGWPATQGWDA